MPLTLMGTSKCDAFWQMCKVFRKDTSNCSGFSLVCHNVENGCFVTVVVLQKNHVLDSASRKYLESLGIAVDVKGHSTS